MDEASLLTLHREIAELERLLAAKKRQLEEAQTAFAQQTADPTVTPEVLAEINKNSPSETKIALFRSLFKGREDIYAKRFESKKPEKPVTSPFAAMNGLMEFAKNAR